MSSATAQDAPSPAVPASAFAGVFQAVQGLRNRRAIVALIACLVGGVVVAGALVALSGTLGFIARFLALIVWVVAAGTGINAAGLLQMDHARGISPRSLVDALVQGLMCIPKLIALGILLFLVEIAVFIVIAIALFLCKIPFLGPLLFLVVLPVSVVVAGLTVVGLFLCGLLSLPAIWQGATIMRALAQTLAIAQTRTVEALLLLAATWLLAFVVAGVMFGVLGAGLFPVLGMSAGMLGVGDLGGGLGALLGGGGIVVAGVLGMIVLWAVVMSLVLQVYLLGLSIVYLRVTDGLDLSAAEAGLRQKLDEAKRRAAEMGEKARAAAQRETTPTPPATPAPTATPFAPEPAPYEPPPAPYVPPPAPAYSAPPAPHVPEPAPYVPPPPPYVPPSPSAAGPMAAAALGAAAAAATAGSFAPPPPPAAVPPAYDPPPAAMAPPLPAAGSADIDLPVSESTDIDLSFDDLPPPVAPSVPPSAGPPAYAPPVHIAMPPPPMPELPPASTCPQCLSPITGEDVFCGVCGYRLK